MSEIDQDQIDSPKANSFQTTKKEEKKQYGFKLDMKTAEGNSPDFKEVHADMHDNQDKQELVRQNSNNPNMQLLIEDSLPNTLIEAYFAAASKHQSNVITNAPTAIY